MKKRPIHKVCPVCKKDFITTPSQNHIFCSKVCGYKGKTYPKNSGQFRKGHTPWNTGKILPKWFKKILSSSRLKSPYRTGKLHPKWKGGKRGYYNDMARKILLKNKIPFKCSLCNRKLKILHIHHKDRNWKNNNLNNLKFLCINCHLKLHHQLGWRLSNE